MQDNKIDADTIVRKAELRGAKRTRVWNENVVSFDVPDGMYGFEIPEGEDWYVTELRTARDATHVLMEFIR